MKKDKHIGNIYVTDAGFTLCVTEWKNRHDVTVEVTETGERIHTDYFALRDGSVMRIYINIRQRANAPSHRPSRSP